MWRFRCAACGLTPPNRKPLFLASFGGFIGLRGTRLRLAAAQVCTQLLRQPFGAFVFLRDGGLLGHAALLARNVTYRQALP